MASISKKKAAATLEQVALHVEKDEWDRVEVLCRPLWDAKVPDSRVGVMLAEALRQTGRFPEALAMMEENLARHPKDAWLEAQLGVTLLDAGQPQRAVELLGRARARLPRDPGVLSSYASALLSVGRVEEAEPHVARALLSGAGESARLVLAFVKLRRGQYDEALKLAESAASSADVRVRQTAQGLRADAESALGRPERAWALWQGLDAAGELLPAHLVAAATAAQLAGEEDAADALIARRLASGPEATDLLGLAQLANLREEPQRALEWLEQAQATGAPPDDAPYWNFHLAATRGRALRKLGRFDEAAEALRLAQASTLASVPRVGSAVQVDLGALALERGEFLEAEQAFQRALALTPDEPEATRGLALAQKRLTWKAALESSAEARVERVRAEAESFRRRALVRENEIDRLKRELERLKAEQREVTNEALASLEAGRKAAEESRQKVAAELVAREQDIEAKAIDNLTRAFGQPRADQVWKLLLTAERTFQKALYTELPAAAVAVLFSGAFERTLGDLLFVDFVAWLDEHALRDAFLGEGVRERRGTRVEYFDRFFEAVDPSLQARPPSLGELARVLDRRDETYLARFKQFLGERFEIEDAFWEPFTRFVVWSKETLRDPVAHGHIDIDWEGVKQFREQLLFAFAGEARGALPWLLGAVRK